MIHKYDNQIDEALARGGTFDITGTTAVTDKQFFGFEVGASTVLNTIKGIPLKTSAATLTAITAAEVNLASYFLTSIGDTLIENKFYRVDGYIITNIKLTSGSVHAYKTIGQIST